ncbi:MAG: hypothetical protein REH83_00835 [Rickettsiella sp.]|nr:hypothetical protein [Rickettsiella sp.]
MLSTLKVNLVQSGWTVGIQLENITEQTIDISQLKIIFIAKSEINNKDNPNGALWGPLFDNHQDVERKIEVTGTDDGQKNIISLHFKTEYMLKAKEKTKELFFGLGTEVKNINDLKNLSARIEKDPLAQSKIILQVNKAPPETMLKQSVKIKGVNYDETFIIDVSKSTVEISNVVAGNYEIFPQIIETDKTIYLPEPRSIKVALKEKETAIASWLLITVQKAFVNFKIPALPDSLKKISNVTTSMTLKDDAGQEKIYLISFNTCFKLTLNADKEYQLICGPVTINNQIYTLTYKNNKLIPEAGEASITLALSKESIDASHFELLSIKFAGLPDDAKGNIPIHLVNLTDTNLHYFSNITNLKEGYINPHIKAGNYYLNMVSGIHIQGKNYKPTFLDQLIVPTAYTLEFKPQISLTVKGWPNYLAHGGITDGRESIVAGYKEKACPIDALYRYAGQSGGGDRGQIIDPRTVSSKMVNDALELKKAQAERPVVAALVIYTAQVSGGVNNTDFKDTKILCYHLINLVNECLVAQSYSKEVHFSFIINPDMIGMLQQNSAHSELDLLFKPNSIEVQKQLEQALSAIEKKTTPDGTTLPNITGFQNPAQIPSFSNDIYGYCQAINWIIRHFSPDVSFGWQFNTWGPINAYWAIEEEDNTEKKAKSVIDFIKLLKVYEGEWKPQFIVFDKYERDDFSNISKFNSFAWNSTNWKRYLHYVGLISDAINIPTMLWQIPGGHMPTKDENDHPVRADHGGSGGTFFLGDHRIGNNLAAIHPTLLNAKLSKMDPNSASRLMKLYGVTEDKVSALLRKDETYNWSFCQLMNAVFQNVFAILWGGGTTTSVISYVDGADPNWMPSKIKEYYKNPVILPK